jgi:hypothetical protein
MFVFCADAESETISNGSSSGNFFIQKMQEVGLRSKYIRKVLKGLF